MIVYLAYPIDFANSTRHATEAVRCRRMLSRNHTVYEPGVAWSCVGEPDPAVSRTNTFALGQVDALVALLPEANSIGVPMEIQAALDRCIPTAVLVSDVTRKSWALVGDPRLHLFDSFDKLLHWLDWECEPAVVTVTETVRTSYMGWIDGEPGEIRNRLEYTTVNGEYQVAEPHRKYEGDAGFDLYVTEATVLEPGRFTNVPSSMAVALPEGMWGLIMGRSSTFYKRGLLVNTAVIDNGFRGELFACVYNPGPDAVLIEIGDRLAQMIPMPLLAPTVQWAHVPELSPSDRGADGFGSTG